MATATNEILTGNKDLHNTWGLKPTKWESAQDLAGSGVPCRLEGEVKDMVVFGEIPSEINGTFYRVMTDPFVPPHAGSTPIDGDGHISAFRFHNGHVDLRMRYIETERYLLERKANRSLFGLYRNPYTHHPCVRAAVDSTANTNVILWAGKFLALKEVALPYEVDPDTLETLGYDPFAGQILSKTFTAHPKVDPFTQELVTFGYEAKGLATLDIVSYALDQNGKKTFEHWLKSPWAAFIHDCGITPNFTILVLWPFEADVERMKAGKHHWAWTYERPVTFLVIPRHKDAGKKYGWKEGEHRVYSWKNCMPVHTAGAWEDEDGKLYLESSRVFENSLPFFPPENGRMAIPNPKADFVRWEFDPRMPTNSTIKDPMVVMDVPSEMPRIDERFMTRQYETLFAIVAVPGSPADTRSFIYNRLNGVAMHNHKTGKTQYFYAGDNAVCQEPCFIPRSDDAPDGDGWIMTMVDRQDTKKSELVILDTRTFEKPIAVVHMPMHVKSQIHGNWVPSTALKAHKSLVREVTETIKVSGKGALEPLS
ncbi:hypothetical protein CLAIMM_04689 [Cladophialophora immunda]|nr:hypothetical protein CLAIMM_04689 [Cladophialophora immunda]